MSVTVPGRIVPRADYGWSADGKSAAEISSDIRQTRYRLESDLEELKSLLTPRRLLPAALVTGGLAALSFLIRRIRRRKR